MEALFLFLILLLGLVLCSFLGGNRIDEGFQMQRPRQQINQQQMSSGAATPDPVQGDNYQHYNGSMSTLQPGSVYADDKGNKAEVIQNADGTQSLQVALPNGNTIVLNTRRGQRQDTLNNTTTTTTTTSTEGYRNYYNGVYGNAVIFYGPNGETATIVQTENGQNAIRLQTNEGIYIYGPYNSFSSTQYYGSTGYHTQTYEGAYGGEAAAVTGPYGNTAFYAEGPYGNAVAGTTNPYYGPNPAASPYGVNATAVTGPAGNTAVHVEGPYGNSVTGVDTNAYYNSLPPGIPGHMIPPGDKDLYILKSQVVPPVCPVCPAPSNVLETIAEIKDAKCPPCPACARCPEPAFECKKVPNYNSIGNDQLPIPVLNDFSTFGM